MIKHCTQANVCLWETKEECRSATQAWRQSQEGQDTIIAKARQLGFTQAHMNHVEQVVYHRRSGLFYMEQEYPKE